MNLKEKIQRFWTLSKNCKGFTLVELIVVIAILAILAGVAIPVYNGYIKKAQEAADQQLLDSINTAFAAACLSNGIDHTLAVGYLTINASGPNAGTIAKKAGEQPTASNDPSATTAEYWYFDRIMYNGTDYQRDLDPVFAMFFAGNEGAKFSEAFMEKNGKTLTITGGETEGSTIINYLDKNFNISDYDREALLNSIFGDSSKFSASDIVKDVDSVVAFASSKVSSNELLSNLVTSEEFQSVFEDMYSDVDLSDATEEQKMSALVVYTAQNSGNLNTDDMYNALITNKGGMGYIAGNASGVAGDTEDAAMIAMQYAVGMAWAKENNKTYSDPQDLFNQMSAITQYEDPNNNYDLVSKNEFSDWLQTEEGEKTAKDAMEGYKAAMNIIGNNSENISGSDLVGDDGSYAGFGNYAGLIELVLGQGQG